MKTCAVYVFGLALLAALEGCGAGQAKGGAPRAPGEADPRAAFVKSVVDALKEYRGANWERASAIAEEIGHSRVSFIGGGDGFIAGEWSYDPLGRVLAKPLLLLAHEHTWLEVQLSVSDLGSVNIESIYEVRERLKP